MTGVQTCALPIYGLYRERLISITKKGKEGADEIKAMMVGFQNNPPKILGGSKVVKVHDYTLQKTKNLVDGTEVNINLPKSDVIQLLTEDGTRISVRPSGTEPKIKFYFGVKGKLKSTSEYETVVKQLDEKINAIVKEMGL